MDWKTIQYFYNFADAIFKMFHCIQNTNDMQIFNYVSKSFHSNDWYLEIKQLKDEICEIIK